MTEEIEQKKSRRQMVKEKAKNGVKKFRSEFKKAMNTAVMAAFGFLIALVWKDVITEFVNNISEKSPVQGKLVSALIVTIICVLGIMILTKILGEKKINKK